MKPPAADGRPTGAGEGAGADGQDAVRASAEAAARTAYGRLVSWLAWQWRDIAAAEDALGDALVSALVTWPRTGVPASPEGWLMTAARRNLLKAARHRRVTEDPTVTALLPDESTPADEAPAIPDARLRLMFVCAHPAIEASVRSALMLQAVLGVDASRIARAWMVAPEAMTKRLVRAKAKIKATGLRFEEPEGADLPERLGAVLEAIYGAYTLDWNDDALLPAGGSLADEALYLAQVAASLMPDEPEALGLLALLELDASRAPARLDAGGRLVPLPQQDASRWVGGLIERATTHLNAAARLGRPGPYQIEAAIQMAHASRRASGRTPWADIRQLYDGLVALRPGVGALIGRALATAYAGDAPAEGLALLDAVDPKRREGHQGWWAAQAHLLERLGEWEAARVSYERALALSRSPALRATLEARQRRLAGPAH